LKKRFNGPLNERLGFFDGILLSDNPETALFLPGQPQKSLPDPLVKSQAGAFQPVMPVFPVPGLPKAAPGRHIQQDRGVGF